MGNDLDCKVQTLRSEPDRFLPLSYFSFIRDSMASRESLVTEWNEAKNDFEIT